MIAIRNNPSRNACDVSFARFIRRLELVIAQVRTARATRRKRRRYRLFRAGKARRAGRGGDRDHDRRRAAVRSHRAGSQAAHRRNHGSAGTGQIYGTLERNANGQHAKTVGTGRLSGIDGWDGRRERADGEILDYGEWNRKVVAGSQRGILSSHNHGVTGGIRGINRHRGCSA